MRGGCGVCGNSITGGSANRKNQKTCVRCGGSAGLAGLPIRYYYGLNDENNNPTYPLHSGGKKKRNIKGGMPDFLFGPSNAISSFGSTSGSQFAVGAITGNPIASSDITVQPVMNGVSTFFA